MVQPPGAQWPHGSIESECRDGESVFCRQARVSCWENLQEKREIAWCTCPPTQNKSKDFISAGCIRYSPNWWVNRLCRLGRRCCLCLWGSIKHITASQREFVITVPGLDFKQALFTLPRSKSSSPKPGLNKLIQWIWFCVRFSMMALLIDCMTTAWNYPIACIWICFPSYSVIAPEIYSSITWKQSFLRENLNSEELRNHSMDSQDTNLRLRFVYCSQVCYTIQSVTNAKWLR